MTSAEIRSRFLKFFENRGHTIIPSAPLVTSDEQGVTNSTLFNTAGMQPLVPYLLGKTHPSGKRLVDVQKCLRTVDIDDIGDKTHATFFEMLGNWSLGDYFKEEAIKWSYEFLTDKNEGLGLDPERLYVTVFEGDTNSVKDEESAKIWESAGVPKHRIYFKDASANWWPAVKPGKDDNWSGPTGPCSEMFYDITEEGLGDLTPAEFEKEESDQKIVEIWNDVFMEFEKADGKIVGKLSKKNVDTGAGLERLTAVLQKKDNIFETDLLKPVMEEIKERAKNWNIKSTRIIADHLRASIFLISEGVIPAKDDRGYILRRLIRRAIRHQKIIDLEVNNLYEIVLKIIDTYSGIYQINSKQVIDELRKEASRFLETIHNGDIKIVDLIKKAKLEKRSISGSEAFVLYSSYGFPIEETIEIAKSKDVNVDLPGYEIAFKTHQSLSRSGAEQKFKGGLADASDPVVIKYHTATHLLHQALHDVLGEGVRQKGSNITAERLRFDFSWGVKMTDEQKKQVEEIINEKIKAGLPVQNVVMSKTEAEKTGARHLFGEKYGDEVSIYFIGHNLETAYSKEFCGGPHVQNTSELGRFRIQKEEAISQGVRRIKAVLE